MAKKSWDTRDKGSLLQDEYGQISTNPDDIIRKSTGRNALNTSGVGYQEMDDFGKNFEYAYEYANPGQAVPSGQHDFDVDWHEFEQSWLADVAGGIYNAGVVGLGQGIAQIPGLMGATIARDLGGEDAEQFFVDYNKNVSELANRMEYNPSDKALGITGGELNSHQLGYMFGQGIGFVAGLSAGGGVIGAGAKALGMGAKTASRVGSLTAGTMMMAPDLYEEGINSGLSPQHAARMALAMAGVVSMTEGAALESIGKSLSKPVSGRAAKSALRDQLATMDKAAMKNMTMYDMKRMLPELTTKFGTKMKGMGAKAWEGTAIEAGQEFSQTYIEEGMKEMYDKMFGGDKKKGEGKYGADVASWDTFKNAAIGGLVGGMVGGTLSFAGGMRKGVEAETIFGHVNNSVNAGNTKNIKKLKAQVDLLAHQGKLKGDANYVKGQIDNMVEFSERTKGLNMDSYTANFQLYQLMEHEQRMNAKFNQQFATDKKTHGIVTQAYKKNAEAAEEIMRGMQLEMQTLVETKEPITWNRQKQDKRLNKYRKLMSDVMAGKMNAQEARKAVDDMMLPVVRKHNEELLKSREAEMLQATMKEGVPEATSQQQKAQPKKDFDYYDLGNKKKVSKEAVDNAQELLDEYDKAIASNDPHQLEKFANKAMTEYGMSLQDMEAFDSGGKFGNSAELITQVRDGKLETFKEEKPKSDKAQTGKRKKVKGYRTKGTFSSKVDNAQRGSGKYVALDKPFREPGTKDEDIEEVEVEYDEDTTLDATTEEGQKKFMEIKRKATEGKKFNSIKEMNDAVRDAMLAEGYTALIGDIEQDNKAAGRELVIYDDEKKAPEQPKKKPTPSAKRTPKTTAEQNEKFDDIKKKYPDLTIERNADNTFESITGKDASPETNAQIIAALDELREAGFIPSSRYGKTDTKGDEGIGRDPAREEDLPEGFRYVEEGEIVPAGDYTTRLSVDGKRSITNAPTKAELDLQKGYDALTEEMQSALTGADPHGAIDEALDQGLITPDQAAALKQKYPQPVAKPKRKGKPRKPITNESIEILADANRNWTEDGGHGDVNSASMDSRAPLLKVHGDVNVGDIAVTTLKAGERGKHKTPVIGVAVGVRQTDGGRGVAVGMSIPVPTVTIGKSMEATIRKKFKQFVEQHPNATSEEWAPLMNEFAQSIDFSGINEKIGATQPQTGSQATLDFDATQTAEIDPNTSSDPDFDTPVPPNSDDIMNIWKQQSEFKSTDKPQGKEQRAYKTTTNSGLINSNPKLYDKIRAHFKRLFPNIPLNEFDNIMWEYGPDVLAKVTEQGVNINTDTALQNTLAHEYAHVYFKLMGGPNSWVGKTGFAQVKGTKYELDARERYPDKTEAEIMEEALMDAIADAVTNKLRIKFEGNRLQKFMAWLQQFWNKVKRMFKNVDNTDVVNMMADAMVYSNGSVQLDSGFLAGMNKDQRSEKYVAVSSLVQSSMLRARVNYMLDPENNTNPKVGVNMYTIAYKTLLDRFKAERTNQMPQSEKLIFDSLPGDLLQRINDAQPDSEIQSKLYAEMSVLLQALQEHHPNMVELVNKASSSIARRPLPDLQELQSELSSAVKGSQRISDSVRSVVTSLIDFDGGLIQTSSIYQYIARTAMDTVGSDGFYNALEKDALSGDNMIASRLKEVLDSLPNDVREGIMNEMQSIISIKYQSIAYEYVTEKDGSVNRILKINHINKSSDMTDMLNDIDAHIDTLDAYQKYQLMNEAKMFSKASYVNQAANSPALRQSIARYLGMITQQEYTDQDIKRLVERFMDGGERNLSNFLGWAIPDVLSGKKDISHITGYLKTALQDKVEFGNRHMFVNSSGNNVSSSRLGYWISELGALLKTNPEYKEKMLKSPIYKNNPILAKMIKDGSDWFIHDAISNDIMGSAVEFSRQNESDGLINDLVHFALVDSTDKYNQRVGVTGDRGHATYMSAPRHSQEKLRQLYDQRAQEELQQFKNRIKRLYGRDLDTVTPSEIAKDVDLFNKITLNELVYENGKWEVRTPFVKGSKGAKKKAETVQKLKDVIAENDLLAQIQRMHVIPRQDRKLPPIYDSYDAMLENYVLNENINRSYLQDLFAGPAMDRKSVADVVKRMSGMNSGGKQIPVKKPVRVVVIDSRSKDVRDDRGNLIENSDSFSFNGSHFSNNLNFRSGPLDAVGLNSKDGLFQVDPTTGHLMYLKMSSLNITGEVGNNSMNEMMPPGEMNVGDTDYGQIGDAVLNFEKGLGERIGDDQPYVKVIDVNALKGVSTDNQGRYVMGDVVIEPIPVQDFVEASKSPDGINGLIDGNSSFETNFDNYRVSFNLSKDLSKVSLDNQNVILSTQLGKLVLNYNGQPVQQFESDLVKLLELQLEMEEGNYESSEINKMLNTQQTLLNSLLNNADDQEKTEIVALFEAIREHNKNNPEKRVRSFDHPNLLNIVQNFIGSKLTKKGVRVDMPGAYLHMLPNYGSDLKWYERDDSGNMVKPAEIALPWSMFANSKAEAEQLLQSNPEMFNVVGVRVPASPNGVSTFAAKVKYFTDGKSNTTILPDRFMKASDADHDADKVFIYRHEISKEGKMLSDSAKSQAFKNLWNQVTSAGMIAETIENDLDLNKLKKMVTDALDGSQIETFSLQDLSDMNKLGTQMSFGADAIGIWAVASKELSMLFQSQEQLKVPLEFGGDDFREFKNDAVNEVALYLQAALDLNNDPVLLTTGVNKHTIGVATTLSLLGVKPQAIIKFLNSDSIKSLVTQLENLEGSYSTEEGSYIKDFVEKHAKAIAEKVAPTAKDVENKLLDYVTDRDGKFPSKTLKEGYNQTSQGEFFYAEKTNEMQGTVPVWKLRKVSANEIQVSEEFQAINKFVEVSEISDDIKKLIPVLQLDNKLPNTKEGLIALKESFQALESPKKPLRFTVSNLLKRPLIQHYKQVAELQEKIYNKHFFTAKPQFESNARMMAANLFQNVTPAKLKMVYSAMKDSTMQYFAQKVFMKGKTYVDPEQAMQDLAVKVKNIMNSDEIDVQVSNTGAQGLYEYIVERQGKTLDDWKAAVREEYPAEAEAIINEYHSLTDAKSLSGALKDNKFMNYIQVVKSGDKLIINGKKAIGGLNDTARREIAESFEDIKNIDKSLYEGLLHHQMMRFGMENKINGYAGILPVSMHMKYLQEVSTKGNPNFIDGFFKKNSKLLMANTAIKIKDSLPTPLDYKIETINNTRYLVTNANSDFVNIDGDVYMRKDGTLFIPLEEGGIFSDGTYTQLAKNNEQLGIKREVPTETIDNLNENC